METITAKTKISELIKFNPKSVDAIASLAKPLEKLKNPILRKIMASRVNIGEAAKMGGTTVEEFKRVLLPLGFTFDQDLSSKDETTAETKPDWLRNAKQVDIDFYDVRPIIDNGADPLKEILGRFKTVEPGKILCIINNFVPTPLIHLLKQEKAEETFVETISDKEFNTYFLKREKEVTNSSTTADEKLQMDDEESFAAICNRFTNQQTKEIDVRELEMPGPMQLILSELEELKPENALYVNHKRVPVYLLEELADKNYEVHINNRQDGDVKMLIFKK
ncbi:DUF2249 domain-containing protein [Chryseobacterium sp. SNU WT5]|uniref:DUF2249 domain-containing protein n=1 Tax=Chryseobacterium sp. SNU WT5 TaxID=2594269 RepID=UPI001180F7C3|nr:DUF2249 domain-containing protein [Chryseobacterium sp. SNU WT5]QDP85495.1 DUF2249 domain-containing protein [Chryseobacterium sp. SNU WT5]